MDIPSGLRGAPDSSLLIEFQETQKKTALEPEQALMLAVLEDAIACYQKYMPADDQSGRALFREAEEWIFEKGDDWIFSFENICEVLGLDPHYVLKGVLDLRGRMLKHRPGGKVCRLIPRKRIKKPAGVLHTKLLTEPDLKNRHAA